MPTPTHTFTQAELNRIVEAKRDGVSNKDLALELRRSEGAIARRVDQLRRSGAVPPAKRRVRSQPGTPRKCLRCGNTFLSADPPSIRRICPNHSSDSDVSLYSLPQSIAA